MTEDAEDAAHARLIVQVVEKRYALANNRWIGTTRE